VVLSTGLLLLLLLLLVLQKACQWSFFWVGQGHRLAR
jgi:hypothetical protein